jgi:hypothetical protein
MRFTLDKMGSKSEKKWNTLKLRSTNYDSNLTEAFQDKAKEIKLTYLTVVKR